MSVHYKWFNMLSDCMLREIWSGKHTINHRVSTFLYAMGKALRSQSPPPPPTIPVSATSCYIFKVNCPVFGQSIIVALSGGYILYYIFLVYLAGMKNVATTACVPCTVLITNGKRKSTEQTCVFTLYLLNCCPIVTLYSLVPRPPLLLPSVCVHNNTLKWSSAPVYYCER